MTVAPLAAAHVIARNIVPLAGVLFLGWSAANVLLLYFLDTLLALAVLLAGVLSVFTRNEEGAFARINGEVSAIATGVVIAAIMAIPIGMPLLIVLGPTSAEWRGIIADPQLRIGALMQVVAAGWSYVDLWRALRTQTPEALGLKRRFGLTLLRWLAVMMPVYWGIGALLGPIAIVVAYVAVSIWADLLPDHFLRTFPGGREEGRPQTKKPSAAGQRGRRRGRG